MPLSDLDCINLCLSQYNGYTGVFNAHITKGGDMASVKFYSDCTAIVHEGSHDAPNWINNFDAIMQQVPGLGGVEAGFYVGLPEMAGSITPQLPNGKTVYVIGHSRGAARAHIFGAMLIKGGYKVEVVTFGSPRPGDAALAAILATAPNRSYFNYHDIDHQDYVADVPFDIELLAPFVHPAGRIQIDVPPEMNDPWGLLARHHSELYAVGVKQLCAMP